MTLRSDQIEAAKLLVRILGSHLHDGPPEVALAELCRRVENPNLTKEFETREKQAKRLKERIAKVKATRSPGKRVWYRKPSWSARKRGLLSRLHDECNRLTKLRYMDCNAIVIQNMVKGDGVCIADGNRVGDSD